MPKLTAKSYNPFLEEIAGLLEASRQQTAYAVNAVLTATYWEIGRRIVEYEQQGKKRAEYGSALLQRLAEDLTARFGRGFGVDNLQRMRAFYHAYKPEKIYATLSRKFEGLDVSSEKYATLLSNSGNQVIPEKTETASRIFPLDELALAFPLPWSAYVRLL